MSSRWTARRGALRASDKSFLDGFTGRKRQDQAGFYCEQRSLGGHLPVDVLELAAAVDVLELAAASVPAPSKQD
jgi:hypothetical protein